jgi:hypothetical protein
MAVAGGNNWTGLARRGAGRMGVGGQRNVSGSTRLQTARLIIDGADAALDEAERRLIETARPLTLRDRVTIAIAHKMLRTFEALVDDAERQRAEAMHHLKTLCECYIYLCEAMKDEDSAALVLGASLQSRVKFWELNPGLVGLEEIEALQREASDLCGGRTLPPLRTLAERHSAELGQWYKLVYRLACEPAHVGDLDAFLPGPGIRGEAAGARQAATALEYGVQIALAAADVINTNEIGVQLDVASMRAALAPAKPRENKQQP